MSVRDEPRDVVDVAVRVVADAAFAQPDRARDAEPFGEDPLVVLACQSRVANLHVAEQPLLGDEHQAVAVDLDAAALEDDATRRRPRARGSTRGSPVIRAMAAPTWRPRVQFSYFAQPLNAQLTSTTVPSSSNDAGRRRVAQPDAIGRRPCAGGRDRQRTPCASARSRAAPSTAASWQRISTVLVVWR